MIIIFVSNTMSSNFAETLLSVNTFTQAVAETKTKFKDYEFDKSVEFKSKQAEPLTFIEKMKLIGIVPATARRSELDYPKLINIYKSLYNKDITEEELKAKHHYQIDHTFDEEMFFNSMKKHFPKFDKEQLNQNFCNPRVYGADGWNDNALTICYNVAIGELGALETSCDHFVWCPLMEENTDWKNDFGSHTFVRVCYETAGYPQYYPIFAKEYKNMILELTRGYEEYVDKIVNSKHIAEFMHWLKKLKQRVALNAEHPKIPIDQYGGFVFNTPEECDHIVELLTMCERIDYGEEDCFFIDEETPKTWKALCKSKDYYEVFDFSMEGINLLNLEIAYKWCNLMQTNKIPKWIFTDLQVGF